MRNNYVQIIAEIGVNHNGQMDMALKLIDFAKLSDDDLSRIEDLERSLGLTILAYKKDKIA